ncbi:aspartyl/asparaginyl beta-hydroxylase domain-containing protein [Moorena producens]|uniref:aspartyl/asparaginyl beta-hydroxylase domain-containing protein n=1 Tax=Moorena producens TaxID=1155739 RepID=UPI003C73D569
MSQYIFDTSEFPALVKFSSYWKIIRDEAVQLDKFVFPFDRTNEPYEETLKKIIATNRNGWMMSWGPAKDKWINYGLRYKDQLITDFVPDDSCPKIMCIVRRLRGIKIVGLSLLKPGAYMLPHIHPELEEEGVLIYHLGLSVPNSWHWLNVEGTFIKHGNGESFVFDGSKPHFALNFSEVNRLILYLEFNPDFIEFDESGLSSELELVNQLYMKRKWKKEWARMLNKSQLEKTTKVYP